MAAIRSTTRQRYVLALLLLTSVTLITLDQRGGADGPVDRARSAAREVVDPIQRGVDSVADPVADWFGGITEAGSLRRDNEALRRQVAEMRAEIAQAEEALRENKALKEISDIPFVGDIPGLGARVIAGPPGNFESTVVIDRGSADGVARDMPVVVAAGLVGRVVDVGREQATVRLVTDARSGVGVRLESGEAGVAQGIAGRDVLRLDFVSPDAEVRRGETATTSGLEGALFPPNIPVGEVTSVGTTRKGLQQDIVLTPFVDLSTLEFVKVLLWSPPPTE